jgi:hypothetical protein
MISKRSILIVFALAVFFALGPADASAEPFETIINNGNSQNRVDLAILGDGYTAAELQKYKSDVQTFVQGFFAQDPFHEYQNYFNVHRIDVTSNQSGADHPERSFMVDTALDATYNCSGIQRLICVNVTKATNIASNTLAPAQRDMILVIVNDSEYGGSGGAVAVSSTNAQAVELILHESGHSFGLLGDEYGGPPPPACNSSFEPSEPNITKQTQRALIKWGAWIDPGTSVPTTSSAAGVPGLYEGAGYCDAGLFRPTSASKMRFLGFPYEQVNSEQLIKRVYNLVSPIDSSLPAASSLTLNSGQSLAFSVTNPSPFTHALNVNWSVDGQLQTSGPSFLLNSNSVPAGTHSVTVVVSDPTSQVRTDPAQVLRAQRTWTVTGGSVAASVLQLNAASNSQSEGNPGVDIVITRTGDTSAASTINYATSDNAGASNCNVVNHNASSRCDYLATIGTLHFLAGETSKTISIPIVDDSYAEGNESFTFTLSSPTGGTLGSPASATVTITDNETANGANPNDLAASFVRQHYIDFLNREPDASGLQFWTNEITSCGANPQCIELKRINVSAAFYQSIEFQDTGYLVYRFYKAAYGNVGMPVPITLVDFLPDTQQIGQGVQVGIGNWQQQLENNKRAYAFDFVSRLRFTSNYPTSMTPAGFADKLFFNAVVVPSVAERAAVISEFGGATTTGDIPARTRAVRDVAENPTLVQLEFNKAFVLMQYFGYLRRNPFDPPEPTLDYQGYNFWLGKLNQFGGNFVNAEMVKAFITSSEYRQRFGP